MKRGRILSIIFECWMNWLGIKEELDVVIYLAGFQFGIFRGCNNIMISSCFVNCVGTYNGIWYFYAKIDTTDVRGKEWREREDRFEKIIHFYSQFECMNLRNTRT